MLMNRMPPRLSQRTSESPGLVCDQLRIERCPVRDALELAVATELPAMKCACEAGNTALFVENYAITAMRTDVIKRFDMHRSPGVRERILRHPHQR